MTDELIKKCRGDHCFGRSCDNCLFIKEDKIMTKKEEIQQEIEKTQKQLAALQEKLKEAEDKVPEELMVKDSDEYYYVNDAGNVCMARCALLLSDARLIRHHRAFLSEEYAKDFADKTQFIADILHFKYLYDRDYAPDWNNGNKPKWYVFYDGTRYNCDTKYTYRNPSVIYFSSEGVAEKCTKWLNKKYGYTKE